MDSKLWVEPPKYDLLYLTNYVDTANNGIRFRVANGKVQFDFIGENHGYNWPKLYRFSAATGAVKEIPLLTPPEIAPVNSGVPSTMPEERSQSSMALGKWSAEIPKSVA